MIAQYPGAKDGQAYSLRDMEKVTDFYAKKKTLDEDALIDYYTRFCPVASYLVDKKKISTLEKDRSFWKGLPRALHHQLMLRFNIKDANRDRTVIPAMDDVMKLARVLLAEDALDLDRKKKEEA